MDFINEKINIVDDYLKKYMHNINFEPMHYSLFADGKRLRPILMIGAYELFDGNNINNIMPFACAIEMIHTYSLIHDDLPAMDNDDYRRGKLTNHKVYGEGMAILAGDALLNLAFEIMIGETIHNKNIKGLEAMQAIAYASGIFGMIGGQVKDLESENKQIDKSTLDFIHENKTAKMIQASLKVGAILASGTKEQIQNLSIAGYNLGMAFQIQDDILDITGDENYLGKPINSDLKNEKSTFVSLYGLSEAKLYVEKYSNEAKRIFKQFGASAKFLLELTEYLVTRKK